MASITIRNLDDDLKRQLRIRAAEHGCSMEQEAREILGKALKRSSPEKDLGTFIHGIFAPLGGVELDLPPREPMPEAPKFD